LRTPLAVIRTEIEVALRNDHKLESMQRVVLVTLDEITRLSRLVDQLLTLSRHDSGMQSLIREEVSLTAVLQDVIEFISPIADRKQVAIEVGDLDDFLVVGNDVSLSQLFFNLLDNAVKFTPAGGSVRIDGTRVGNGVIVTIEDTGIGIERQHLPHLFTRFYRVDTSRNSASGGAGLGLAICQSIVEAHGGKLEVASEPGRGSVFRVILTLSLDALSDSSSMGRAEAEELPILGGRSK